jgi:arylsulfatase A-like enzyme
MKPNIVLIFMDNLGYGELGVYGGGILRGAPTPNIDELAKKGTVHLNFNVEAQCTLGGGPEGLTQGVPGRVSVTAAPPT